MNQGDSAKQDHGNDLSPEQVNSVTGAGDRALPGLSGGHELPVVVASSGFGPQALPDSAQAMTLPLDPAGGSAYPTAAGAVGPAPIEARRGGAARVVAILASAALVGGVAGFGGSLLATSLNPSGGTVPVAAPSAVTVNNPNSVNETAAVAGRVLPSTVTIGVAADSGQGSGSGVIISADGYVVTNAHVATLGGLVADPQIMVTTSDGKIFAADIVGTDPLYDIAVLKLRDAIDLTPIEWGDSDLLNVGEETIAIGAPMGLANSVTTGIISALDRSIRIASSAVSEGQDPTAPDGQSPFEFDIPGLANPQAATSTISIAVIQTDAAINPGNSGGALVDDQGRLIGINVAIASAKGATGAGAGSVGLGFAIPANVAHRLATEIIETGAASHGLLGATVKDARGVAEAGSLGAVIAELAPGGAAVSAGLRTGDIVTQFNGAMISGPVDLTAQVRALAPDSEVALTYLRDGQHYEVQVTLGELSAG